MKLNVLDRLKDFLNQLNALGSLMLAYALANPNAFGELRGLLPQSLQPYAPLAALLWFGLVQLAKARAIKQAQETKGPPSR